LLSSERAFTDKARVLEVTEGSAPTQHEDLREPKRSWEIVIEKWERLTQEVDLGDASTSLTFVRNWRRPSLHVRPAYRRLPDADLETIERGDLFLARATYLTFLGSLPPRTAQLFLAENFPFPSRTNWEGADYADRSAALVRFIEERVLSVGKVVVAAQNQWEILSSRMGYPKPLPLCVGEEDETAPINLTSQAEIFGSLLLPEAPDGSEPHPTQLTDIAELITSSARRQVEARFERLFRNRIDERP
jgi:hypothetical protein